MANWTREGFPGKMFALSSRYIPTPEGVLPPVLWGDEATVRERLGASVSKLDMTRRTLDIEFPFPPNEMVRFFREYFGPTRTAFSRLDATGQAAYANDLENLWKEHNEGKDGTTNVRNEYLEVVAIRA